MLGPRLIGLFAAALLIGVLTTWLSQPFRFPGREESMLFFTIGAMLGLGWRFGSVAVLGVAAGAFLYYIGWHRLPPWIAAWTSITLAISVSLSLWGIRHFTRNRIRATPLRLLLIFYLFGVLLAPTLHTLMDLPAAHAGGLVDPDEDPRAFLFLYWLGEALGALTLAPALMLMCQGGPLFKQFQQPLAETLRHERTLWALLFVLLLGLTGLLGQRYLYAGISDVLILLFAMLLWSAFRFSLATTMIAVLAMAVSIFSFIAFGIGGTRTPWDEPGFVTVLIFVIGIHLLTQVISAALLERHQKSARLAYLASHDPVTGLRNVQSLRDRIEKLLVQRRPDIALGYIEIDEYASVRNHHGPSGRDQLLRQVAEWLKQRLPDNVEPYHVTAGEFAMLFTSAEQAREALDALLQDGPPLFDWHDQELPLTLKAGYAGIDESFDSPRNLLNIVGSHVHQLPRDSRHAVSIDPLNDGLIQQRELRARWHGELLQALAENRFSLLAQPICPLNDESGSALTHVEFLLRLHDRDGESIEPGVFLPHAEQLGLMPEIDRWVIDAVLRLIATHLLPRERKLLCNINLSGQSLNDDGFTEYLLNRLASTRVPREMLCFEITESIALANIERTRELIHKLHDLGCSIAVDDFGTGAATLEYLKRLPVDYIKIDGSFIRELEASQLDYLIVDAIAHIASEHGVRTIAEYVESDAVVKILRELRIDFVQGFLYGRPETLDELLSTPQEEELRHA